MIAPTMTAADLRAEADARQAPILSAIDSENDAATLQALVDAAARLGDSITLHPEHFERCMIAAYRLGQTREAMDAIMYSARVTA